MGVGKGKSVGVGVGVNVGTGVAVGAGVGVCVAVGVGVNVGTGVAVGVGVAVGAGVSVGVNVRVGAGEAHAASTNRIAALRNRIRFMLSTRSEFPHNLPESAYNLTASLPTPLAGISTWTIHHGEAPWTAHDLNSRGHQPDRLNRVASTNILSTISPADPSSRPWTDSIRALSGGT